ncbi:MAG: LytTR family transcriptional regulator [Lachnospiraceae bacterium]|nr:LytTR family transcriptional regulator [Lachnospiraceae bacterium]
MELLIFIGAIFFCLFATLCADNMQMLQIDIKSKKEIFLLIVCLIPPFILSFIFGINQTIGIPQFIIVMAMVMLIIAAFSKNLKRAVLFSFYGIAVISGSSVVTILFLDLFGLANIIPESFWGFVNAGMAVVIIFLCHLIKYFIKKRFDMNIFNNRIIYLLIMISVILLAFIYINRQPENISKIGGWLTNLDMLGNILFLISTGILFFLILRFISNEIAMKNELSKAEASQKYIQELEERIGNINKQKSIQITVDEKIISVKMEDIVYIETTHIRHKLRLHTENHLYEFNGELKNIERQLDERFIRCHRSYIINKGKIAFIDKKQNSVMMTNDLSCHVSKNGRKLLEKI